MNVDEMQKKLSQKATQEPEHQFENLYGLLCNEGWLRVAAHKVLSNEGSRTAGVDSQTKSNFLADLDGNITRLQEALKAKDFEPMPVKRVYTAKEAIVREKILWYDTLWIGNEDRRGWSDIREEVIALKGTTCHMCGTELHVSEVEIDHATKPRARFKDKREADRMKHLQPICTSCHRAKTKADPKVESRMR